MKVDSIGFNGNAANGRKKEQFINNKTYVQSQSFSEMLQECLDNQEVIDNTKEQNSVAKRMLETSFMPRLAKH